MSQYDGDECAKNAGGDIDKIMLEGVNSGEGRQYKPRDKEKT